MPIHELLWRKSIINGDHSNLVSSDIISGSLKKEGGSLKKFPLYNPRKSSQEGNTYDSIKQRMR